MSNQKTKKGTAAVTADPQAGISASSLSAEDILKFEDTIVKKVVEKLHEDELDEIPDAENGSETHIYFGPNKPLFIRVGESVCGGDYSCINITTKECDVDIDLSETNLKKLQYLIQERLKGERCHFTEDDTLVRQLEDGEIEETPVAELKII